MAATTLPTIEYLRQCFDCDAEAGVLRWRERPRAHFKTMRDWNSWNARYAHTVAGCLDSKGRMVVGLTVAGRTRSLLCHRVIVAMDKGEWPPNEVDHAKGQEAGNGIGNLRLATHAENQQNRKTHCTNTSGFPGVSPDKNRRKWSGRLWASGRFIYCGWFDSAEAAFLAYLDAKVIYHPFAPEPRGLSEAAAAVEAWWWFDRRRWRAIV